MPISIDTFRWEVAEAGIKAGANCINDVYAFTGPDSWPLSPAGTEKGEREALYTTKLKAVAREHAVPVILMHSRGDAGRNKDYSGYKYVEGDLGRSSVLEGVRVELGAKVDQIVLGKGGVRRWLVIADPGIGFSKALDGNLELLRSARDIVAGVEIGDSEC
jgi:dihydroneopterin aldolase/2-amino-4-hydroxy-6-hydroxymethyldihydropteridine diphosphokinase/dihydropteroate synthase